MKAKILVTDPYGRYTKGDILEIDAACKSRFGYIVPFESEEPLFYKGIRLQGLTTMVHFYPNEIQILPEATEPPALTRTGEQP